MTAADSAPSAGAGPIEQTLAAVRDALTGLSFGSVALTIHEGRVVQIDVTERRRFKSA